MIVQSIGESWCVASCDRCTKKPSKQVKTCKEAHDLLAELGWYDELIPARGFAVENALKSENFCPECLEILNNEESKCTQCSPKYLTGCPYCREYRQTYHCDNRIKEIK
jgi:hypothetical protein